MATIVYVSLGRFELLRESLTALVRHTEAEFEVICVDNGSPNAAAALAATVDGAQVVLNARNEGFGLGCNIGAAHARAPYVVFLNTDALPEPGWLEPLLAALEDPEVAASSPLVLDLDGRVQNAGPLVANDGATLAYREGAPRTDAQAGFVREVDYANGACLAVRRSAFFEVGGFDAAFGPAYFEDVDLCFALRRHGYRSVHVPRSTIRHVRGASSDPVGARAIASRNLAAFARRWSEALAGRPRLTATPDEWRLVAARDAPACSRLLVLFEADPPQAARRAALLTAIRARQPWDRLTCCCAPGALASSSIDALRDLGVELLVVPPRDLPAWLRVRRRHYDAVIAAPGAGADAAIAETQPGAAVADEPLVANEEDLVEFLARLGVAPGA